MGSATAGAQAEAQGGEVTVWDGTANKYTQHLGFQARVSLSPKSNHLLVTASQENWN